jgi:hypothetical protein
MRNLLLCSAAAAALLSCKDSTAPVSYPDVAGIYELGVLFDGIPQTIASAIGLVGIVQESRNTTALSGSALVIGEVDGSLFIVDGLRTASVGADSIVIFRIGAFENDGYWRFTGWLTGENINGIHTLSNGNESLTGTFTMIRQ